MKNVTILLETPDFAIIHKPAHLLTHKTEVSTEYTLTDWITKYYPETAAVGDHPDTRPGIIHRLDKETSGLLVIARTQKFFKYFKRLLQEKKVKKTYLALVHGVVKERQTIDAPIGLISGTTRHSTRGKNRKMIKDAITEIEPAEIYKEHTLIKAYPRTGRTHQIRVHLASIGRPIVGDKIYGGKKDNLGLDRHFLHASALEFSTPDGNAIHLESELPQELQAVLDKLQEI